jgi:hypothetical protein
MIANRLILLISSSVWTQGSPETEANQHERKRERERESKKERKKAEGSQPKIKI